MSTISSHAQNFRVNLGKYKEYLSDGNLLDIQLKSYKKFLHSSGEGLGLSSVFKSVFPVESSAGDCSLEFMDYCLEAPNFTPVECVARGTTYSAKIKGNFRLVLWDIEEEDQSSKQIKAIKEQEVYIGDLPLMTDGGSFVVNGIERILVSQLHRSPGVFFFSDGGKTHSSGKLLYSARIIPYRGSWLDFEFDAKDVLHFRIDKKRKKPVGILLRALGLSTKDILQRYSSAITIKSVGATKKVITNNAEGGEEEGEEPAEYEWKKDFIFEGLSRQNYFDLVDANTGELHYKIGTKISKRKAKILQEEKGLKEIAFFKEQLLDAMVFDDVTSEDGSILVSAGELLTEGLLEILKENNVKEFKLVQAFGEDLALLKSLVEKVEYTKYDALSEIYKVLRPGEPQTDKILEASFDKLFFDGARYDLSSVGRMMINSSLNEDVALDTTILTIEDILLVVEKLLSIKSGVGKVDDIDSLANRRVRTAGELMENQFRVGLVRMERIIMERMSALDIESIMPNDLVSSKALTSVIRDFIGGAQLSQFMDQTNPLSEITHKRRLSSLGVGGLSRDRAGFEARDIHPSHYGRICPVETPEGPNIGLINSLSSYARLNDFGFIETPFKKVKDGQVSEDVEYLSTIDERGKVIAQADTIDPTTTSFKYQVVSCRANEDFIISSPQEINYADVSARQLVSVASSLIPFLENDDANRALMGSNMMRQAVPLVQADAPLVGTGMEKIVARDSGAVVIAKRSGVVARVDASKIVIEAEVAEGDNIPVDIYKLRKFERTNQNTCINQKPIVAVGDIVKEGDIIADGSSIKNGELALGKNVMVAFMPWNGYNFEDSILISERLVSEDVFTSIHIEQFEVVARDTKLGPEEITRDIPNVSEDKMMNLDEMGIVRIGAKVKAGDILVGKVTPKSESPLTPEEKLLRAIFGEKAHEVRDTSLRVKLGIVGTVTDVKIFTRRGLDKDERALLIENIATKKARAERNERYKVMVSPIVKSIVKILSGQVLKSDFETLQEGDEVTEDFITSTPVAKLFNLPIDKSVKGKLSEIKQAYDDLLANLEADLEKEIAKIQDDPILPSSVLKTIKVSVAVKRKLKPGDKMAGRHGNKGVISKIRAVEDMPYFEDGTPVDIVLNPLGVPSRMNVGQIMETHLGWASVELGKQVSAMLSSLKKGDITQEQLKQKLCDDIYPRQEQKEYIQNLDQEGLIKFAGLLENGVSFANPVFDGPKSEEITQLLQKAGCCETGQVQLYDGLSGEPFARKVTVGMIYMLKLHHLVDEKMHARSVGPYSLITQQPLGGKSHFGGQRFGEMECWALQAYGAAHSLQEMLTYKSDDMIGRVKIYNTLVKGVSNFESGIPESFNVMVKEMRSLCLNLELKQ